VVSTLHVLHVAPYFEHAWAYGGVPRVVSALAHGLVSREHEVHACTTDAGSATERMDQPAPSNSGLTVHVFPNLSNRLAYHWQLFLPRGLRQYLRTHARDFDVAHIHACRNLPGVIAARELARAGVPYVLSPHGTAPRIERRQFAKWLFDLAAGNRVMKDAARIIVVSEAEHRQLQDLGVGDDRIRVVPNPIDLAEFDPPVARREFRRARGLRDEPIVMFLGKLTPRKRLDVLARAFATLSRRDARLVIAGNDMGYERELRRQTGDLGIAERTSFTGLLTGRQRLQALADADVVVYASKDEIFGLVPLEAILCGTPVVVADDSGCGEVIRKVGGGLIVPEGDAAALAGAIASILDAPVAWRARAAEAQPNVRALCNPDAVCQQLEAVYREVIRS
jgi:glycosyltransferase involved in cell wall biosynthesis